jgi:serpin B
MRFRIHHTIGFLSLLGLGFLSCKKDNPAAVTRPLSLPAGSDAVITASNQFAFKFFNTVLQQDPALTNKLVSPLSVYSALSMVYNGAANATRDSIAKALQLNGISIDDLNTLNKALITQMPGEDSKVKLNIANSIWYNQAGLKPLTPFLDIIRNDYNGQVQSLDFANASAASSINSWVAQKTNDKIRNIIDETRSADWMYLINAVYFNGAWKYAFKTANTQPGPFNRPGGVVTVPFMGDEWKVRVDFDSQFTLVDLPYGAGKSFDMYLVLPKDKSQSITDFAATFDLAKLESAASGMDSALIGIELPKWEYAYSIDDMQPHLTQMGMGIAFHDSADLSDMYSMPLGKLRISQAIHKTYIKVSEQGTEAAGVTFIGVAPTSMPAVPLIAFDRPFIYLLREQQSGAILFIGLVTDPSL